MLEWTRSLTQDRADKLALSVYLEVSLEMRLLEKDPVTVGVGTAKVFGVFVRFQVL